MDDVLGTLQVRFHFNGEFVQAGKKLHFVGGSVAMSYIDRDKVSLPEFLGHLKDHCIVEDCTLMHWQIPGRDLTNGLRALVDDKACLDVNRLTDEGCVADIYVEGSFTKDITADEDSDDDSAYEAESEEGSDEEEGLQDADLGSGRIQEYVMREPQDKVEKQIKFLKEFYSPSKGEGGPKTSASQGADESSDSEFVVGDDETSGEDEEAKEILKKFKEFKKKLKSGQSAQLDDVFVDGPRNLTGDSTVIDDEGHATPYGNSPDEEESYDDLGSADEVLTRKDKFPRFSKKDAVPKFSVGMKFTGKKQFKKAIIKYGLAARKVIKFVKDDGDRVRAKCDWPTCGWVCLLSTHSNTNSWQIACLKDAHTCPPRRDNKLVTARRIAEKYEKMIRANPTWRLDSMKETVQEEMFADISIPKLKRAKSIVMKKLLDATKGQYQRVFDYQLELLRSNPGSTVIVKLDTDEDRPIFQRMYIGLDACKKGFLAGCRRVVGLDGCFFKGATNGELLCAVGRDANNQMYPIAWAVVEKENNDTWDWFCDILFKDLSVGTGEDWVFISDQQKGILNAVQHWAPMAEHRNCARHIYANWRKKFKKKEWQKKWWRCAKAPCPLLFNLARAKLAQHTRDGAQAILNTDPKHWSRAWFRLGSNCDSVDNNLCESFNKWIVEARFYPIITMLEIIRRKVMVRIQENVTKLSRWDTVICPNILKKLNSYIISSGYCHAVSNGNGKFEVVHWDHRWTVDLAQKTCSCRYWQLAGLPCPHAISCIYFSTHQLDDYLAACFRVEEFKKTYSHYLEPVEGIHSWAIAEREKPEAPGYVRMPGRPPKKERKRESNEKPKPARMSRVGSIIRCKVCKGVGHNKTTCNKKNGGASNPSAPSNASGGASNPGGASAPNHALPAPNAMVVISNTQQSAASGQMVSSSRKRTSQISTDTTTSKPCKRMKTNVTKTSAMARVTTQRGGSATINLHAKVPLSQASSTVTVQVSSGKANAKVKAKEPVKRRTTTPAKFQEYVMMHPGAPGGSIASGSNKTM